MPWFLCYIQVKWSLIIINLTRIEVQVCLFFDLPSKFSSKQTQNPLPSTSLTLALFLFHWHLLSSYSLHHSIFAQWPDTMRSGCCLFCAFFKGQWICRVMAIVLPYWSLTGHIEAQQDFKGTKAVYCIVLSSKWRSPSSYREQSLEMSAERGSLGEEMKRGMVNY